MEETREIQFKLLDKEIVKWKYRGYSDLVDELCEIESDEIIEVAENYTRDDFEKGEIEYNRFIKFINAINDIKNQKKFWTLEELKKITKFNSNDPIFKWLSLRFTLELQKFRELLFTEPDLIDVDSVDNLDEILPDSIIINYYFLQNYKIKLEIHSVATLEDGTKRFYHKISNAMTPDTKEKIIRQNNYTDNFRILCRKGYIKCLDWSYNYYIKLGLEVDKRSFNILNSIASLGCLETDEKIFFYLLNKNIRKLPLIIRYYENWFNNICEYGDFEYIEKVYNYEFPFGETDKIIKGSSMITFNTNFIKNIIKNHNLDTMKFVKSNIFNKLSDEFQVYFYKNCVLNNLDFTKYLFENKYINIHLELQTTFIRGINGHNKDVFEWLIELNIDSFLENIDLYITSILEKGTSEMLELVFRYGMDIFNSKIYGYFKIACLAHNVEMVKYIYNTGLITDKKEIKDILELLLKKRVISHRRILVLNFLREII